VRREADRKLPVRRRDHADANGLGERAMTSLASLRARLKRLEEQRAARGDDGPLSRVPLSELFIIMHRGSEDAERVARLVEELRPECATEMEIIERVFKQLNVDMGLRTSGEE
jgi:hypothetical protein